jgi:para-nitrobenzyl esterase
MVISIEGATPMKPTILLLAIGCTLGLILSDGAHASGLGYPFDRMKAPSGKAVSHKDRTMARTFHQYIVNFTKSGDPSGAGLPAWSKFDPAKFDSMLFANAGEAKMQDDPWWECLVLVERAVEPQAASPAASELGGTAWQLVKFEGGDGTTLTPDDKAKYTLAFESDGRVNVRIDCNRGRGTWKSSEPTQLAFGPLALTRAMCPPGSLHDRIVKDWSFVRSYTIKDDHLFLALMADGGIYEFEPLTGSPLTTP